MKKILTLIFASMLALATFGQDVIEITFDEFQEDPFIMIVGKTGLST